MLAYGEDVHRVTVAHVKLAAHDTQGVAIPQPWWRRWCRVLDSIAHACAERPSKRCRGFRWWSEPYECDQQNAARPGPAPGQGHCYCRRRVPACRGTAVLPGFAHTSAQQPALRRARPMLLFLAGAMLALVIGASWWAAQRAAPASSAMDASAIVAAAPTALAAPVPPASLQPAASAPVAAEPALPLVASAVKCPRCCAAANRGSKPHPSACTSGPLRPSIASRSHWACVWIRR